MSGTRARFERHVAPRMRTGWRRVRRHLPPATATAVERRGKRALKRLGWMGPVTPTGPAPDPVVDLRIESDVPDGWALCPICGTRAAAFGPAGRRRPAPDRRCPGCGSLERHRAVWLYLVERTELFQRPHRMLHVAPESHLGPCLQLQPHIDYLSADLDPLAGMVELDVTDIDLPDASFDVIYASHVLEHVPDDRRAMRELFRVLRPGGWAVLQVPIWGATTIEDPSITDPAERTRLFGQEDHVRMYGRDGVYEQRLRDAGFDVSVVPFVRELAPELVTRFRLRDAEDIHLCRRPTADAPG